MATYMSIRVCITECPAANGGTVNIMSSYAAGNEYETDTAKANNGADFIILESDVFLGAICSPTAAA
jgi:hypothetical protein